VEARFSAPVQADSGALPAFLTVGTRFFPGVQQQRRGVDYPSHLAPRLKEENSYTCTPPLGLRGPFLGEEKKMTHHIKYCMNIIYFLREIIFDPLLLSLISQ
jgi:hypothetical protein